MSLLLFLLPSLVIGQWRMGQPPSMMGQFPQGGYMPGYPQMSQGNGFDIGMYNPQSSFGDNSQLIQPGMSGYGGFNLPSTYLQSTNNIRGGLGYPNQMPMGQQSPYPFPIMGGGVPSMNMGRMGGMQMGGYPSQELGPMGMPRPSTHLGQFQADSVNRDIEKPTSSLQPTRIIPPFMKNATPQQLDQFYSIVQNPIWSPSEKQQKIEEFVRSMDTNSQNVFASYSRTMDNETETKRQKVHQLVDQMSPEAQVQFQKVSAVMTNSALNETERLQKIQDIYSKISDEIKKEFDQKLTDL